MIKELLNGKKAILFDLDGTLVDSMWMWGQIDIEFLGRFGYECPEDLQKTIEGMSFSETAVYFKDRFDLPMTLDEIKECWIDMSIEKYRHEVPLKDGALEFLKYCKANGIKTAIATSNGREIVDALIDSLQIGSFLQEIITACEVNAGKPEPDIYLEAARRLSVPASDCLVFEDIPAGILAGKRAGMTVIAVEDAWSGNQDDEIRSLSDGYIQSFYELL
ncbi:MAG: HAD family phosphatase [Lachnospiraceae bacterium]|nr:HAD family phosphatase [Lachnospiraceae bacterium]